MGAQAGGSAILGLGKTVGKHPLLSSALTVAALLQVSKSITPGGRDNFLESIQTGFDKVTFGLFMGAIAGVAGLGRLRGTGRRVEDLPIFADMLTATPRAAVISMIEGWVDADPVEQQKIETIINKLAEDPLFLRMINPLTTDPTITPLNE